MKYRFKTKPMRHQVKALKKFLRMGGGALFAEMGTGKTKIAIDFAGALTVKNNRPMRAVVLCPKSVLSVWPEEIKKHDPWGEVPHVGTEWYIYSIDSAWRPHAYDEIILRGIDILIVDESDMIKSVGAQRSKGAYFISKRAKHRLIMSGTPIGKNRLDLFAQYRVVHPGIFGTVYSAFASEYALMRKYKVVAYLRTKKFRRKIKPWTFSILKSQCLDLPERRGHAWDEAGPLIVPVELSRRSQKAYDDMAKHSVAKLEGLETWAPIVLTQILRLQQLSSGILANNEAIKQIGKEKQFQLQNDLEEMRLVGVDKIVIFVRFIPEMIQAAQAAKQAGYKTLLFHGGVPQTKTNPMRTRKIKAFHNTKQPVVFIAQYQTGSRGIDLTCANECICYGLTGSLIQYGQCIDRQHRMGQENKVTYRHYVARGTIDETTMMSLVEKKEMSREILEHPSLLYGTKRRLNGRDAT